jgi:hypothetical protein
MKAIFEQDTSSPTQFDNPFKNIENTEIGDLIYASHLSGVIYDYYVTAIVGETMFIKPFKVNEWFYSVVQKAYFSLNR